ncbi:MAG: hypothetical protein CFE32_05185 [Alphaproteobacteria bacterium PA3]|nr:MAG: hypothetical protein CFE32_05185 [Alphaproteobacteria bacterium PA3]
MLISVAGLVGATSGFLAWQTFRAERAAHMIDMPILPTGQQNYDQWVTNQLQAPRDARLWDVLSSYQASRGQYDAAIESSQKAVALAPAQPWAWMRLSYYLAHVGKDPARLNKVLADWQTAAPHARQVQVWRLAIATNKWDVLTPETRALTLLDAEDVCVQSGLQRTLDLAQKGQVAAYAAVKSRLERMGRPCAATRSDAPPLLE